jgi:hypothetical protein
VSTTPTRIPRIAIIVLIFAVEFDLPVPPRNECMEMMRDIILPFKKFFSLGTVQPFWLWPVSRPRHLYNDVHYSIAVK